MLLFAGAVVNFAMIVEELHVPTANVQIKHEDLFIILYYYKDLILSTLSNCRRKSGSQDYSNELLLFYVT
jgi:hypothetical protein